MVEISEFLPDVLPETPGCPEMLAKRAILDACIRFCRDTYSWQEEIDQLKTKADRELYEKGLDFINSVNGSELISLVNVGGQPFEFDGHWLRVRYTGDDKPLAIQAALQPVRNADRVPGFLYNDYRESVAAYALYRLLMQSRVEWANPELAGVYRQNYRDGVAEEKTRMVRGHSTQPLTVSPVRFV